MLRNLAIVVVVLVVGGVGGWLLVRKKPGAPPAATAESRTFTAPLLAMKSAPEGKTPCETAYNAFRAFEDANPKQGGFPHPWHGLPARDLFLARCAALPAQTQTCLQPRYSATHNPECDPILNALWQKGELMRPQP